VRNQWIVPYGGALLLIVVLAIALFYWRKGAMGHSTNTTGRRKARWRLASRRVVGHGGRLRQRADAGACQRQREDQSPQRAMHACSLALGAA
jgi:hypothetical protein